MRVISRRLRHRCVPTLIAQAPLLISETVAHRVTSSFPRAGALGLGASGVRTCFRWRRRRPCSCVTKPESYASVRRRRRRRRHLDTSEPSALVVVVVGRRRTRTTPRCYSCRP